MSSTITSGAEQWARDTAAQDERARSSSTSAHSRDAADATRIELGYSPFPKQQQFHSSPAKYRLFGGAAGPGKSKALLMEAILQAHEHPGANTLLLRRTFPELEQSLLLYFRRDVPRELYKSYNDSKHVVTWHNNSTTRFGYCQSENDVYQYQGAEFLFIGIDELTLFTLRQWQFLTSRNRCPVPGAFPSMAAATNPGNIGHAWVKALWIDKQPAPGMENPGEYDPADYDFIPARVTDNPIYAADENYLKTLRALPSHLKRAFLDGDWDVFAGQYFDKFDFARHVIRPEEIDWKPWWPRWISIDWGFEHHAATYWHAAIPGNAAPAATSASNPAAPSDRSVSSDITDRREAPSSVEGQGVSPDINDRAKRDTSLPKAVAQGEGPERHASDVGAITAPNPAAPSPLSCHPEPGRISGRCEGSAFSSASNANPNPAAAIADENRAREQVSPKFPRRPRSWLGFAGTIPGTPPESPASSATSHDENSRCVVSYREYVTHRTPPRELAREIVRRSVSSSAAVDLVGARHAVPGADTWRDANHPPTSRGDASSLVEGQGLSPDKTDRREAPSALPKAPFSSSPRERTFSSSGSAPEKIDAIYLSPDAFARRTDEASIAEQMGDVFVAAGLPRPIPADDDRIGGWMLMYQMLDAGEWLLTENCAELIRSLPNLIRDPARIEDIEKMDGDDAADAARYGIKSRYGAHRVVGERGMPLTDRIAARVVSDDPTIRAMQARKAQVGESRGAKPVKFPHRRHRPHHG
jgi:hypothetical protein